MSLRVLTLLLIALLLNSAWIAAFAAPTLFYMGNVLLHLVLGLIFAAVFFRVLWGRAPLAQISLAVSLIAGLVLACAGNTLPHRSWLWSHITASILFVMAVLTCVLRRKIWLDYRNPVLASAAFFLLL